MGNKTIVCRCEELTVEDIEKMVDQGHSSLEEIKRLTRCGMGPCQGRTCRDMTLGIIARKTGKGIDEIEMTTFRPPIKPIKLKSLIGEK